MKSNGKVVKYLFWPSSAVVPPNCLTDAYAFWGTQSYVEADEYHNLLGAYEKLKRKHEKLKKRHAAVGSELQEVKWRYVYLCD